jgi:DNA/RNA-binding domain of Phe-tRNA-synthetase-like protein
MTGFVTLDIGELAGDFPTFRAGLVVARGLAIQGERPPALDGFVAETEARVAAWMGGRELADIAELKSWREAYKAFGVKKTSYRSSVERLLKNIQRGAGVPRVNALVDAYNAVSARFFMPIGADDLDRVTLPLAFRYAREGDSFIALGDAAQTPDPPKPGEVVYADAAKCLCRRWNWYQDARSAVSVGTTQAVLTVQTLTASRAEVAAAAEALVRLIADCCAATAAFGIADSAASRVTVEV